MRHLSEIKNEEALELIANCMEPVGKILGDPAINQFKNKKFNKIEVMKWLLKDHSGEIMEILASIDDQDVETYEISALELPMRVIDILSNEELTSLFTSQGQRTTKTFSGSVMENTEAEGR